MQKLIDQEKIEKVTKFKYLGQPTHLKGTTKEKIYARMYQKYVAVLEKKPRENTLRQTTLHITQKTSS